MTKGFKVKVEGFGRRVTPSHPVRPRVVGSWGEGQTQNSALEKRD